MSPRKVIYRICYPSSVVVFLFSKSPGKRWKVYVGRDVLCSRWKSMVENELVLNSRYFFDGCCLDCLCLVLGIENDVRFRTYCFAFRNSFVKFEISYGAK